MPSTQERRRALKATKRAHLESILAAGCKICGYRRCRRALVFHHRDPRTKTAKVSTLLKDNYSLARLQSEVDQCDLLCANCHAEVHEEALLLAEAHRRAVARLTHEQAATGRPRAP